MRRWFDSAKTAHDAVRALLEVERYVRVCGLGSELLELVRLRVSQINGCAYCIDRHMHDARALGAQEQRLHALATWSDTPFFTDRERAALAWTEAVTRASDHRVAGDMRRQLREHFSEKELVDLTMAVIAINAWNRLVISSLLTPGAYLGGRDGLLGRLPDAGS